MSVIHTGSFIQLVNRFHDDAQIVSSVYLCSFDDDDDADEISPLTSGL